MPRQANGSYVAPANTTAVPNATISSSSYNTMNGDIGNELTSSLDRSGRGAMLADLDAGGFKVKNLASPAVDTDAVTRGYANSTYLQSSAGSVGNSNLATAPNGTVKGTLQVAAVSTATVTISIATPAVVSWTGHGLVAGTPVVFTTTGALPTGLSIDTPYYVSAAGLGVNSFSVSATVGGASINTSGAQSGVHTASSYAMAGEQDLTLAYIGKKIVPPYAPITPGAVGLKITNDAVTPDTKIAVTADGAYLASPTVAGNARHYTVSVTINATVTGANGIDAGALAASTWYYVFLISDGTTVAGLVSASTSPTLPTGYSYYLRVGAVRTDGTIKFYRTLQRGNNAVYVVTAATNTPNLPIMASGAAGNISTPTWVAVSTSSYVPPTAGKVAIVARQNADTMMLAPNSSYGSSSSATNPPLHVMSSAGSVTAIRTEIVLETSNVYWASQAGGLLACYGWSDGVAAF